MEGTCSAFLTVWTAGGRSATTRGRFDPNAGRKGDARPLRAPGTYWEYNDVRINQLSLALLHLRPRAARGVRRSADAAARRDEAAGAGKATTTRGSMWAGSA
ncbi:MAG: hypothetical protein U1F25_16405 [Rubrivivax sp.]